MAAIQVGTGGDIRQEIAAPEDRWSLNRTLAKIRSLRPNFNNGYLTHAIFENLRKQEIGKLFLNMIVPALGITVLIWFTSDNPNKKLFEIILLLLFVGGLAIFNGLLFRDTYPLLACIFEQLGIFLVCFSISCLVATMLSGPALIIPAFCIGLVLIPFIIPTLPRDEHVMQTVSEHNTFCAYSFLYHQKEMLCDRVHMDADFNAVSQNKHHFFEKTTLNVGLEQGTIFLAIWSAQTGQKKFMLWKPPRWRGMQVN